VALASALIAACASDGGDDEPGACANVEGTWTLFGTCSGGTCDIVQHGCDVTVSCSPAGDVYSGKVSEDTVALESSDVSCRITVDGPSATGSCSKLGVACGWQASCTSGACSGKTGDGGSPSGVDCGPACLAITSCCPTMSAFSCKTGCEQTSGYTACKTCFDTTDCGALIACLRADCYMPKKVCPGL
jgi:hypothetical protein